MRFELALTREAIADVSDDGAKAVRSTVITYDDLGAALHASRVRNKLDETPVRL